MAAFKDKMCRAGGTWENIASACAIEGESRGVQTKFTPSVLKAHVKFRLNHDPKFFGSSIVTENGIEEGIVENYQN